jgi:hypothetical protein
VSFIRRLLSHAALSQVQHGLSHFLMEETIFSIRCISTLEESAIIATGNFQAAIIVYLYYVYENCIFDQRSFHLLELGHFAEPPMHM